MSTRGHCPSPSATTKWYSIYFQSDSLNEYIPMHFAQYGQPFFEVKCDSNGVDYTSLMMFKKEQPDSLIWTGCKEFANKILDWLPERTSKRCLLKPSPEIIEPEGGTPRGEKGFLVGAHDAFGGRSSIIKTNHPTAFGYMLEYWTPKGDHEVDDHPFLVRKTNPVETLIYARYPKHPKG